MKRQYITNLRERDQLDNEAFLLRDVQRRMTKTSQPYLLCVFGDNSGQMNGVFWNVPEPIDAWVKAGDVVLITGQVNSYRDALQINATDFKRWPQPDMRLFLPASQRSNEEMVSQLREMIESLGSPWRELTARILLEPDFLPRFATAPAARNMHHAYIGGLLEHTLSMAVIAQTLAEHYPYVNSDLLLAGVLLHDAGKVNEYDVSGDFAFTDDGRLIGHILRSILFIEQAAPEVDNLSEEELRELVHLVASHHGKMEWGSPVVPKTVEAILLHQLDLLDSRMQGFYDHISSETEEGRWTTKKSPMFQTELRRPPIS